MAIGHDYLSKFLKVAWDMMIPEGKYVELDSGLKLHYYDQGSGPVVIFLHGAGPGAGAWVNFSQNFPYFVEKGFRCLGLDFPGFGRSDKPEDAEYTDDFFVAAVKGFVDKLGLKNFTLLGNSLGGAISLAYTLKYPEGVDRMIMMAPGGVEDREAYFAMEGVSKMVETFNAGPMSLDSMRKVMSLQMYDASLIPEDLLKQRLEVALIQPKNLFTTMRVANMEPRLGEIKCPILGFWGINDKFNPYTGSDKMLRGCQKIHFVMMNRCGHWVMLEHKDLFNRQCVDFLTNS